MLSTEKPGLRNSVRWYYRDPTRQACLFVLEDRCHPWKVSCAVPQYIGPQMSTAIQSSIAATHSSTSSLVVLVAALLVVVEVVKNKGSNLKQPAHVMVNPT